MMQPGIHLRLFFAACALASGLGSRVCLAAGVAPADATPEQKSDASSHLTAGKEALTAEQWDKAMTELRVSLDIVDSPNTRLQLARALRNSGHTEDAWTEYGRVIENATKLGATDKRYQKTAEVATAERGEVEGKLAFVTVTVTNAPAAAKLSVAGRSVPSDQWGVIATSPGMVDVVLVDGDGVELAHEKVQVAVGEKAAVGIDGHPAVPTPPSTTPPADEERASEPAAPVEAAPAASSPTRMRPYAYVAGGIGVVGLATFGVFGLMSNSTYNDLQGACHPGCPPEKRSEIDTGRTQQTIEFVGLGVGLVALATGVTLWVASQPQSSPSASASLVIAPGYLGLRGSL